MDNSSEHFERKHEPRGERAEGNDGVGPARIRLSTNFPWIPLHRQTPGSTGHWGRYRFITDDAPDANEGEFAGWIVYNNLPHNAPLEIRCPRERTVLLVGEPPSRGDLNTDFAAQFGSVISCLPKQRRVNGRRIQQALPWWIGLRRRGQFQFDAALGYDDLSAMKQIEKPGLLSIVCSNLIITPEHRQRLGFVRRLQSHFGDRLAVFGAGFRSVEDKWDAIAPFKYHVALENSSVEDYWTEKLSDTFLGGALPIYGGCPNIHRYFPRESLVHIRIDQPEAAIEQIEQAIAAKQYEASREAIWASRQRILNEYNLFPVAVDLIESLPHSGMASNRIRPSRHFAPSPGMRVRRLRHLAREAVARRWYSWSANRIP